MKANNLSMFCVYLIIALGVSFVHAALPTLDTPTANVTECWKTNASGWVVKDMTTDTTRSGWVSNAFVINYGYSENIVPITESIYGATNASSGRFVGNYSNNNIEAITFDVNTYGFPPPASGVINNPKFFFHGGGGERWVYLTDVIPCDTHSNWVNVTIPMLYSASWVGEGSMTGGVHFAISKTTVSDIGVLVRQLKSMPANQCMVRNVKLVGPWGGPFTNGVSVAWLSENGLSLANAINNTDNFGRPLLVEFLASTDPNNTNDVFRVEIGRNSDGKTVLKWKENNKYARYDLLEGTDLADPGSFTNKSGYSNMQGSGTQKVAEVDGNMVSGPRFYKIQVRVP